MRNNNLIRHIENSQFSVKKAREFYTNYESISPHDKSVKKMDDIKMETIENGVNTETTEEYIDTETTQEEMDTHDNDEAETHMSLTSINFEKLKIK